jgi:hypothetical protein
LAEVGALRLGGDDRGRVQPRHDAQAHLRGEGELRKRHRDLPAVRGQGHEARHLELGAEGGLHFDRDGGGGERVGARLAIRERRGRLERLHGAERDRTCDRQRHPPGARIGPGGRKPRLPGRESQPDAAPVLARRLLHHALPDELDLRSVRVEARAVRRAPPGAVHLVGDARAAAALARDADGDGARVARAASQPREVALERRDLLADLALLYLRALLAGERLAAAPADQLDHRAQ